MALAHVIGAVPSANKKIPRTLNVTSVGSVNTKRKTYGQRERKKRKHYNEFGKRYLIVAVSKNQNKKNQRILLRMNIFFAIK